LSAYPKTGKKARFFFLNEINDLAIGVSQPIEIVRDYFFRKKIKKMGKNNVLSFQRLSFLEFLTHCYRSFLFLLLFYPS